MARLDYSIGVSAHIDQVMEVMRYLPYFDYDCTSFIHYKSRLVDDSTLPHQDHCLNILDYRKPDGEIWSNKRGRIFGCYDFFPIATGVESFGRYMWVNVKDGEILEEARQVQDYGPADTNDYLNNLKDSYRTLKLIPCSGRITIEAEDVSERPENDRITEEQVCAQEEEWGTDLDVQFIRHLYRLHGWPDTFHRSRAFGYCLYCAVVLGENVMFFIKLDYLLLR
jgi:hypothetical protein